MLEWNWKSEHDRLPGVTQGPLHKSNLLMGLIHGKHVHGGLEAQFFSAKSSAHGMCFKLYQREAFSCGTQPSTPYPAPPPSVVQGGSLSPLLYVTGAIANLAETSELTKYSEPLHRSTDRFRDRGCCLQVHRGLLR